MRCGFQVAHKLEALCAEMEASLAPWQFRAAMWQT